MNESDRLQNARIKARNDYIDLLVQEIDDLMGLAIAHRWESKRVDAGLVARRAIYDADSAWLDWKVSHD